MYLDDNIPNLLNPVTSGAVKLLKDIEGVRIGTLGDRCASCSEEFTTGSINFAYQDAPAAPRFCCIQCGLFLLEIKHKRPIGIGCYVEQQDADLTVELLSEQKPKAYIAFYDAVNRTKALTGVLEELRKKEEK